MGLHSTPQSSANFVAVPLNQARKAYGAMTLCKEIHSEKIHSARHEQAELLHAQLPRAARSADQLVHVAHCGTYVQNKTENIVQTTDPRGVRCRTAAATCYLVDLGHCKHPGHWKKIHRQKAPKNSKNAPCVPTKESRTITFASLK